MKLSTAPLLWDLDASGNTAPQVTPGATTPPVTFNLSGLDGRTEDLWNYAQALWLRVSWTATQAGGAPAVNRDRQFAIVDSLNLKTQVIGDVLAARSNSGQVLGNIDQVIGGGYAYPTPIPGQINNASGDTSMETYFRVPLALDCYGRPQDFGIWAPIFEKGQVIVNLTTTAASKFGTGTSVKNVAATIRGALEILPFGTPQIHAPSKFVRYEMNTSGPQLKLFSFGNGDGMTGVNPGARLAMALWLSSAAGMGGVDTIDKWTGVSIPWRHQKVLNNPDLLMGTFLAYTRRRGVTGSAGATVVDPSGFPYAMGTALTGSLLDAGAMFYPLVFPGYDADMSGAQKQVGDLPIDAQFSANPNGTHVFRTLEHYTWQPAAVAKQMGMMGFDLAKYTAEPKTHDNTDPRLISDGQLWGLPLRIVERAKARKPIV